MGTKADLAADAIPTAAHATCAACGGGELEVFFEIESLPVNCIALCSTRETALGVSRGAIELGFCRRCGAVSNLVFDASKLSYDPSYDNSLHFSSVFQKYAEELAHELVERHQLRGKNIIEIGCGNAEFLSLLCGLGNNRAVGFDPAFIPGRADLRAGQGITVVPDYYSEEYAQHQADFVICRHVLEHIAEPRQFLRSMRAALAPNPDASIFFELPNAAFVFQKNGIWDVIYEHCFYYSSGALARLFSGCGFDVQKVAPAFSGQYLCLEARISSAEVGTLGNAGGELEEMRKDIWKFAEEHAAIRAHWEQALRRFAEQGKRVALWGAGAKGAMFLNAFNHASLLEYTVDVNPHKWGLYVPGTGQKVVSSEFLKVYQPNVLLIANPNYHDEISRQMSALGIQASLLSI
jgi:SAM-dependent methyltransferase